MKLGAEVFTVSCDLDEFVVDFSSFNAGKSHSPTARDLVETFKEVLKAEAGAARSAAGGVDTKMTDVNSGQYDFSEASPQQSLHLLLDVLR